MADLANGSPSLMSAGFWKLDNPMAWLVGAVTLGVLYIAYRKFTADDTPTTDTNTDTTPSVSGGGGASVYNDESFPLKKGMKGKNVTILQTALGVSADGKFWNDTEKALKTKYSISEVSQDKFTEIVTGKKPTVSTVSANGKRPVATSTTTTSKNSDSQDWFRNLIGYN